MVVIPTLTLNHPTNSDTSTIPSYTMSFSRLPGFTTQKLDSINSSFLWNASKTGRVRAKVKWVSVCKPKKFGGLGIRNLAVLNKASSLSYFGAFLLNQPRFGLEFLSKYFRNSTV